jgi:hypothetical protein
MRSKDNIVTIFITIGPKNVTVSLPNFERRHLQKKTVPNGMFSTMIRPLRSWPLYLR